MIKYLELTAPEESAFRQSKIISVECAEGDQIEKGATLFRVKSGSNEIDLPATRAGKIIELIAVEGENITISTPLLLLETVVEKSTASQPIEANAESPASMPSATQRPIERASRKQAANENQQQQILDLAHQDAVPHAEPSNTQAQSDASAKQQPTKTSEHDIAEKNMANESSVEVTVPDIGGDSANVIEILVEVGDQVDIEDPLVTLESDKASMEVPSSHAGKVTKILVEIDQEVSEGAVIIELSADAADNNDDSSEQVSSESSQNPQSANDSAPTERTEEQNSGSSSSADNAAESSTTSSEISVPDIGGDAAKVIEILVKVGDSVEQEDPLITLESDKASMEVPSPQAGVIESIEVELDQEVSEGVLIAILAGSATKPDQAASEPADSESTANQSVEQSQPSPASSSAKTSSPSSTEKPASNTSSGSKAHASPSIRRFARELGVDLGRVEGSGRKNRITKDDVKAFVKGALNQKGTAQAPASSGAGIPAVPDQDFSKFGEIERKPLNKIKKLTATNLHRSWLNVPHVTHNDEANITNLEDFRKQTNQEYAKQGKEVKLSPLAFIVKAVVNGLKTYPQFNSSLESGGENLIYKKYFNIGIAVDTPNGLVVPVIKDADKKSIAEIAEDMGTLAAKARDRKLTMNDMSGACFTISSLGGIGGTGFTPIVNAPEVAILGVSRSKIKPDWNGSEFVPAMMLPLSLSYDHRVIDGAEAARFTRHIAAALEDLRRLTL